MEFTVHGLNKATLGRQMLLRREDVGVGEAVRRVVALQAQMPPSPYVALWNRIEGFEPGELDREFAGHGIVKATLMRITLHAVHADDYPCFREAMEPTLLPVRMGRMLKAEGLDPDEVNTLVEDLLVFLREPRESKEVRDHLCALGYGDSSAGIWRFLAGYAHVWHAPVGSTWSFSHRPSFVAARCRAVIGDAEASAAALRELVLRYLEGFGPATVADVAQFASVQNFRVKEALAALSGRIEKHTGPDGKDLFDVPGAYFPDEDAFVPPRLMAMWDSVMLAYKDRSRIIPPEYRTTVIRKNGDVLPTVLVDGYVAGIWRALEDGVEITAFRKLSDEAWEELAEEARAMRKFLAGRDPLVYRRYHHWWDKMPPGTGERVLLEG